MNRLILSLLCGIGLAGCSDKPALVSDCTAVGAMQPVCTFQNPEDIEALPDGKTLLVSQMGKSMESADAGSLVFFEPSSQTVSPAFPSSATEPANNENWGTSNCPGNPGAKLAPHGISLRQRADRRWQLAVVNHGGRESVELFELLNARDTTSAPQLAWRGCVPMAEGMFVNDVVVLKNGGFIGSHMFDKRSTSIFGLNFGILKTMLGIKSGYVFERQPGGSAFRILDESHGAFINGVEMSADERHVYANVYFGGEVLKLDRQSGKKLGSAPIGHADNLAWDEHGNLLDVAHTGPLLMHIECNHHPGATCALDYAVHRINPETMASEIILQHAGAPMGAATVAREHQGKLWLGSFTGNRLVSVPYSPK